MNSQGSATLGMRRLAIFDPANGHQPMCSPDGRFTLVFNGAIYNFRTLRSELGHWEFRTNCDTEVLLAAYVRWGARCVSRLRGMFAFAVWDAQEQSLFLARDPFGIKPLYYRQDGASFAFASELNALKAAGLFGMEIDSLAVADYLAWLAVPAPRTIYRGVFSLRPGESATFAGGRLDVGATWTFGRIPQDAPRCRTRREFVAQLRERLEDTVRAHVVADVPVGAFLSGGLDSAAVTGLMTRVSNTRLRTFSIDMAEPLFSEAAEAETTARHFGTDHRTTRLTGADVARDLDRLLQALDQPTGDGVNTFYASQAARAGGVTVALSGLGGDEVFGGYPSFRDTPRLARWLRPWRVVPGPVRAAVQRRLARGDTRRRKLADVLAHAHNIHEVGALQRRVFTEPSRRTLLNPEVAAALGPGAAFHPALAALARDLNGSDDFDVVSAWELRTYMADVLLRDSDVMSMRHSLELRVPLVDRPLIEWVWRQPAEFKADPRHPKSALAEALEDILPPGLAGRPKRGFTLPFDAWMRRELRPFLDETFSNASVDRAGLLQREAVQSLWRGFRVGHDTREWSRVWSVAMLIAFANRREAAPRVEDQRPWTMDHGPGTVSEKPSTVLAEPSTISEGPSTIDLRPSTVSEEPSTFDLRPVRTPRSMVHGPWSMVDGPRNGPWSLGPSSLGPLVPAQRPVPAHRTRTLLLAPAIFSIEGGIPRILQTYLRALCALKQAGGAVRLLALNDAALAQADLARCSNGEIEAAVACNRHKIKLVREALRLSRGCDDIVCGHVFMLPVAWLARRLNPKLRYYLVAHGIDVWRRFTLVERIALRDATKVFCVSDYTRRELLKNCPLPPDRAVVLHNALDPTFTIAAGRPLAQCPPNILLVTRLTYNDRYKGVEHMIAAMPAIRRSVPAARLRIVGRGDDIARLRGLAEQHAVASVVDFFGYLSDAELATELRTCRLFALPSKKEGFGLVFLEAMAQGRPCLGARAGGVPEVITPETGVLADYGDVPGIAAAAISALQREWSEPAILDRAREFSFEPFKQRLGELLAA